MDPGRRRPALAGDLRLLTLGFTAGVLLVHALRQLPGLLPLLLLIVPVLLPWRGRQLWTAFTFGVLLTVWCGQAALADRWPPERHGEELWVQGAVASLPEVRRSSSADGAVRSDWRFEFTPEDRALPRHIRVSWYRSEVSLRGGECWRLKLRLRSPHGSLNPGGFDYEAWLLRQQVGALATVREGEPCGVAAGQPLLKLRQAIVSHLQARLGEHPGAALLIALSMGDTSGLRDGDWEVFRRTGTTHLVAISGMHLVVIAGFAFLCLRWLWSLSPRLCLWLPAQRLALYGSALLAVIYAFLAGFQPPVARAMFMLLILVVAAAAHRLDQPSRALALAWLLILLLDPFAVLAPGLWLSFGAVAAIFYLSRGRWRAATGWRLALQLQLLLSLVLAPLTLGYFHGFAWASPLINLLAVPLFTLLSPLLLVAVLVAGVSDTVGGWLLLRAADAMAWSLQALRFLSEQLPQAWIPGSPPWPALALAVIGAVLLFVPRGLPLRRLGVLCCLPLLFPVRAPVVGGLEITALDVGQGLAVVVRTPQHVLLFDAGPAFDEGFDAGASVVVPYLLQQGIREIDLLLLSHGDNDHAGGVAAVRRSLPIAREIGTAHGTPCRDGERWIWDGVAFELLHPDDAHWSSNNSSCVLRIGGSFSALLPGDIERAAEARLLQRDPAALAVDLLLTPHHGSRTSSTAPFVQAVAPAVVVHSAGWRSRFGHPRPEISERYAQLGAQQYTTGVSGAIRVWRGAPGAPLQVESRRAQAARWWNAAAQP